MHFRMRSQLTLFLLALLAPGVCIAEVYVYVGPDGERLVTDRMMSNGQYRLVSQRDTVENAGRILANRPIATGGSRDFQRHITGAAHRFGVDPTLVTAVIEVESGFDPSAVSARGATGLMQLMSATAKKYRVRDRFDPRANIYGGVEHLSDLMEQFDGSLPLVLAAYNAGAGSVERYRGVPPFPETRRYIDKVMRAHVRLRGIAN